MERKGNNEPERPLKISPYDKVQALKHSKKYAEDYRRFIKDRGEEYHILHGSPEAFPQVSNLSESAKELCKKYNLRYPIDPNEPVKEWEIDYLYPVISFLDPPESWRDIEHINWTGDPKEAIVTYVNGKLVVMIDTAHTREKIKQTLDDFLDMIAHYRGERTGGRDREIVFDKWRVYRMHEKEGKNLLQITRELVPEFYHNDITDFPTYNKDVDAHYRRVRRAYKKAHQIIKAMEEPSNF